MEVLKLAYFVALKLPDYWYLEFPCFRYVWYCLCNGSKTTWFSTNVEIYCNLLMLMDIEPLKVDIIQRFLWSMQINYNETVDDSVLTWTYDRGHQVTVSSKGSLIFIQKQIVVEHYTWFYPRTSHDIYPLMCVRVLCACAVFLTRQW